MKKRTNMNTSGVQSLITQIDSFLQNTIKRNARTQETIDAFRKNNVIEVTVHSDNTVNVSIEWLEERFKNEGDKRRVVPSHDILEYTGKFPLHETSDAFLETLHKEFDKRLKEAETTINEKSAIIDEQISSSLTRELAAQNIAEEFILPNASVKRQLRREIENALDTDGNHLNKTIEAIKATLSKGIEITLISENRRTWGALNNRRGKIGENRTAAAMAQVLENFMGISVMGMKTHTFLAMFLQNLNIQLTYRNEYDPVNRTLIRTNEVEHDIVSTWIEEDSFVIAVVQSKTMEIKPSRSNHGNETQVAVRHVTAALNQVLKDFKTFQEMFPDISESLLNHIRYEKLLHRIKACIYLLQI